MGDIEATWALLDGTAVDADSTACGGTADDNNVFGEGRLDALALLNAAPIGDAGDVEGTVTDADTGDPVADVEIEVAGGETNRTATTGDDGTYSVTVPAGDYTVTATKFGYVSQTANVTVTANETVTQDFALATAATVTLNGVGQGRLRPGVAAVRRDRCRGHARVDVHRPGDGRVLAHRAGRLDVRDHGLLGVHRLPAGDP